MPNAFCPNNSGNEGGWSFWRLRGEHPPCHESRENPQVHPHQCLCQRGDRGHEYGGYVGDDGGRNAERLGPAGTSPVRPRPTGDLYPLVLCLYMKPDAQRTSPNRPRLTGARCVPVLPFYILIQKYSHLITSLLSDFETNIQALHAQLSSNHHR